MELTKKLMNLYLKCLTQQQIADEVGITKQAISDILSKLSKNGKYADILQMSNFQPFLYNIWNLQKN